MTPPVTFSPFAISALSVCCWYYITFYKLHFMRKQSWFAFRWASCPCLRLSPRLSPRPRPALAALHLHAGRADIYCCCGHALAAARVLALPFGLTSIAQRKCIKKFIAPPLPVRLFCSRWMSFRCIEPIISGEWGSAFHASPLISMGVLLHKSQLSWMDRLMQCLANT